LDRAKFESTTAALEARLAEIEHDLRAAKMSALARAKLVREFADKLELKDFGQNVEKRRGRPPGVTKLMAERLNDAVPGKSLEAKQKWIERALKVAGLPDEVIEAAKKAGLAESQSHLLAIAEEKETTEQRNKIEAICEARKDRAAHRKEKAKRLKGKKAALILFPADREQELVRKLLTFVEAEGIELVDNVGSN
jgi:hypothetical protein